MGISEQFKTYQDVNRYEAALSRHGQYVRWVRSVLCPCLNSVTLQPNVRCTLCKGRGRIHKNPGSMLIKYEKVSHDEYGRVYPNPNLSPIKVGSAHVYKRGSEIELDDQQPSDGSYIQLASPYPKSWEVLHAGYEWDPEILVVGENSDVINNTTLRTNATRFVVRGKVFTGSISEVIQVYNKTKDSDYTVLDFRKDFIYLSEMEDYETGDILSVSYKYLKPFSFLLTGITPKMRYERPYILEEASSQLVTPYWAKVSPDDLITALSVEQYGSAILDPNASDTTDKIKNYFDIERLVEIVDQDGTKYVSGVNVRLSGRNEIQWITQKPSKNYTVQFMYHPTYIALRDFSTMRNSENKEFVNKINLIQYDNVSINREF